MNYLKSAALAVALWPVQALAQTETMGPDGNYTGESFDLPASTTDIVVTATGIEQRQKDSGQAISLIDDKTLQRSQALTVTEALKAVPGLSIAERGAYGSQSSAFIRGGNSSQTLVLIDGVRVNDPSSPNGVFDFGSLTTGNIDRIEVLRGPNSIVWGSQAIGGVISIRNAEPTDRLTIRARGEYGSYDTASASANIAGKIGMVSASLGGSIMSSGGVSTIRAGTERDGYKNLAANGKLSVAVSESVSLDLRGFFNRSTVNYDAQFSATPDTLSVSRDRWLTGYAGLNFSLAGGRFRNRLSFARTDIRREGSDPATPVLFTNYNIYEFAGGIDNFDYQGVFELSKVVTLIAGASHERSSASAFFPANGVSTPDRASTNGTSFFGQAIVKPLAGLTLAGGVRHDDLDSYGKKVSLGGNLSYTPNNGTTIIRATISEGFRAPTLTEALLPFGNPSLTAETASSFDLGIEQKLFGNHIRLAATWFKRVSNNQITFSFITFQSENIERVRAEGLELELEAKPTDRLTLSGSYSLVDVKDRSPGATFGKQLERRPRHVGTVSLDWISPWKLALGTTLTVRGNSFEDRNNSLPIKGFALVGVRASYPISQQFELFARAENLFDKDYETVLGYGNLRRNFHAGVRAKF